MERESKVPLDKIETEKSEVFDVIPEEKINGYKESLRENLGLDLSDVSIKIVHPGDDLYEHYEIQHKLFLKCNSDFDQMLERIKEYQYDPNNITIDQFKDIADREGIVLEGKFPGFAMTAGDDEIIFFGIKDENVIEMAEKYALKEGGREGGFSSIDEAKEYLGSKGEKYFFHEAGHIAYKRLAQTLQVEWKNFIEEYPDLVKKVIDIQEDKYNDESQIPVSEEAFADFFVDVASQGELISRLGENKEAVDKLKELLAKARTVK